MGLGKAGSLSLRVVNFRCMAAPQISSRTPKPKPEDRDNQGWILTRLRLNSVPCGGFPKIGDPNSTDKQQAGTPGSLAASTPSPWLKSSRHMQAAATTRGTSGVASAKTIRTVGASKMHCKAKAFCTSAKGGLAVF